MPDWLDFTQDYPLSYELQSRVEELSSLLLYTSNKVSVVATLSHSPLKPSIIRAKNFRGDSQWFIHTDNSL